MKMRGSTAGLDVNAINTTNSLYSILLDVLDKLISSVILAPAVVGYWRGTWNLMDDYLYPNNEVTSAFGSLLIGITGHLIFTIFQSNIKKFFNPNVHRIGYYLGSRVYTAIFGIVCVNGWRGGWQLIDLFTTNDILIVLLITLGAALCLALFKAIRNISASPFILVTDHYNDYFDIPTMFKMSGAREPGLYVLDCMFSVLVIGSLVVFVWRGVWVLADLTLLPEDPALSAWSSLIIGYSIVGVTFALQPIMRWACDRLKGFWRIVAADMFLFFSFLGTVNVWRGVWQLLDVYFLPDNKHLSDWITHGVSLLLLILLNCSNSVLVRGVYIDAEEPAGQCVVFPVYYIRLFFQKERTKKQRRLLESLERQDKNNTIVLLDNNSKSLTNKNNKNIIMSENNPIFDTTEFYTPNQNEKCEHTVLCTHEEPANKL